MAMNSWKNRWHFEVILLLLVVCFSWTNGDLVSRCEETCQAALSTTSGTETLSCNDTCKLSSCQAGCGYWDNTTADACTQQCNSTFSLETEVQFCGTGCLFAEDEFAAIIRAQLADDPPPRVASLESITNDSVDIRWDAAEYEAVTYRLQWRYVDIEGSTWTFYHRQPVSDLQVTVTGLHPYVSYQFRIQWIITPRHVQFSPPSNDVQTDPYGPPLSAPIITSLVSPSPTTVSASWKQPNFPSGPITQYVVEIDNDDHSQMALPVTRMQTFIRLQPGTMYNVTVRARNAAGYSPDARQTVTTLPPLNDTGIEAYLVVGVSALFFPTNTPASYASFIPFDKLGMEFPTDVHIADVENTTITDVAVHYWKKLLYLSDSSGAIHRRLVNVSNLDTWNSSSEVIYNSTKVATLLTVDWLFDHLYFAQEYQILRCDLMCSQPAEVVIDGLDSTPTELHVDSYNGFIYWSELGLSKGIYRLDIAQLGNNAHGQKQLIVQLENVETFLIDPTGYQVIFPNASNDSLVGSFLDGSERETLRDDEGHGVEYFTNVSSLTYFNNRFAWTRYNSEIKTCSFSGGEPYNAAFMYFEGKSGDGTIQEYTDFDCTEAYHGLDVYHPYYQPIPAPATPPTELQVLFSDNTAQVSWVRPTNLESTGQGAWQEWTYQIEVTDVALSDVVLVDSIQDLTVRLENLTSDTGYSIRVRGYSQTARGPWSQSFRGTTLKQVDEEPYLVFATSDTIKRISLDGTGSADIANRSGVRDFAWDGDALYWCENTGAVFRVNLTDPGMIVTELPFTSYTEALAVDWFTGRLYRGSSNQQDLAIDSVNAYMYWTTTKTVECSRFNSGGRFDYERISGLSDDLIAGVTLDLSGGFVYWFLLANEDSVQSLKLYRAQLAGTGLADPASSKEEVSVIPSNIDRVALSFYSQKLFWINEQDDIVIGSVEGSSLATLPDGRGATTLSVIQDTLHPVPDGFSSIPTVIPSVIPADSIQITGPWQNFDITWRASSEVNYGTVFYDVSVMVGNSVATEVVQTAAFNMIGVDPFQPLTISVQPYTYWGSAEPITATRRSPMSVPTVPQTPRVFGTESKDIYTGTSNYSAVFRWDVVMETNGILLGYKVRWGSSVDALVVRTVDNATYQFAVDNLGSNATYYFQVEGFTAIDSGPATSLVNLSTNAPSPPPVILSIGSNGVTQTDTDTQATTDLLGGASISATAVTFMAKDRLLFWADSTDVMVKSSNFDGSNEQDLFAYEFANQPQASGLAVDWVSRCLYAVIGEQILKYDTTLPESSASTIANAETSPDAYAYLGIVVDPLKSRLYWTQQTPMSGIVLMTSDLEGQGSRPLLGSGNGWRKRQACSCSENTTASGVIAMDLSDAQNPEVFFAGPLGDIYAVDLEGCQCRLVVPNTQSGLPPDSLTVDQTRVYWTNTNQGTVASADKVTGQDFKIEVMTSASIVAAFGDNLQPYPEAACLAPPQYTSEAQLVSSTRNTLNLTLAPAAVLLECTGVSTSAVTYTVHYGKTETGSFPFTKTSRDTDVLLEGLDPFTQYSVRVSASNYYTVGEPALGPTTIHMTSFGVPAAARNVTVTVLDPNEVKVYWLRPLEANGPIENLHYKVVIKHMANAATVEKLYISAGNSSLEEFEMNIDGLVGGSVYGVQVKTYPESAEAFQSLSQTVTVTTFQVPNSVTVLSNTADTIALSWKSPSDGSAAMHRWEYLYAGSQNLADGPSYGNIRSKWPIHNLENETEPNTTYLEEITGLVPYSYYHLRVQVIYVTNKTFNYSKDLGSIVTNGTAAGLPPAPAPPTITEKSQGFEVRWTKPTVINGPDNDFRFILQAKSSKGDWVTVYQGSLTTWDAKNLTDGESYTFRVAGQSIVGVGPYSATTAPQIYTIGGDVTPFPLYVVIIAAVVVVLILLAIIVVALVIRRRAKRDAKWRNDVTVAYRADTELATLRQYPTTIIQKDNSQYAVSTTVDGKVVELPIFPRERLKLITFLGSGAFGEVFEGLALNIHGADSGETRVAVKTLKQGATDQEKEEFLKEAVLMGNFHDKNILALLGVCLDNDPQFIILELMEGGDLLSYLRGARGNSNQPCRLGPLDLVDIVIDVAKGCRYLESLKFVHRDLAARNCLVSTKDYLARNRSVKIGDFGLARDIYKSDYYRKEGEGLLPVRWMSPEALMDGVFSVQSDVWAFGVLVWEVMTLGQQPYPARTNLEVLHYVTTGGRLDRPDNCPDDIHHLMLKCWEKQPEGRPSFHSNLEKLNSYLRKSASMSSGVDNPAFDGGSIKYLRLGSGANAGQGNEDYLQPMDSAQSLGRRESTDLAEIKAKAQEDARRYQEQNPDPYSSQGAKPKARNPNRDSLGLPQGGAAELEPRYTAAPSSFSKATGAKVRPDQVARQPSDRAPTGEASNAASNAPRAKKPLHMKGSWVDPEKKEKHMKKAAENKRKREEVEERRRREKAEASQGPSVIVMDEPYLVSKPAESQMPKRRAPNPFRQDSGDEAERRDYTNWPKHIEEDPTVYQV